MKQIAMEDKINTMLDEIVEARKKVSPIKVFKQYVLAELIVKTHNKEVIKGDL
ncbi:MAG: hypothetical protein GY820_38275 [Gammaproteobacteria bacterium]|nr:hypothetical protein [Gammaproteobacteria bacterium]